MKTNTGNTIAIVSVVVGIVIVGALMMMGNKPIDSVTDQNGTVPTTIQNPTATIHGKTINLIVADTEESRELGLSGRDGLADDQAMLFVFDNPAPYEFWMKDMKFAIDIMWLDLSKKIIHIERAAKPESYPDTTFKPESDALYVLETKAGFADKNNIKIGDVVEFSLNK